MKTQKTDDMSYDDIINELTPKFAPETTITFKKQNSSKYLRLKFISRSLKVAAIAIVAIIGGIALFPEPTYAIPQILETASRQLRQAQSCIIEFSCRAEEKNQGSELYKFSPMGKDIMGKLSILKDSVHTYMRVEWYDNGTTKTQLFENDNYKLIVNGKLVKSQKSVDCNLIYELLRPRPTAKIFSRKLKWKNAGMSSSFRTQEKTAYF